MVCLKILYQRLFNAYLAGGVCIRTLYAEQLICDVRLLRAAAKYEIRMKPENNAAGGSCAFVETVNS